MPRGCRGRSPLPSSRSWATARPPRGGRPLLVASLVTAVVAFCLGRRCRSPRRADRSTPSAPLIGMDADVAGGRRRVGGTGRAQRAGVRHRNQGVGSGRAPASWRARWSGVPGRRATRRMLMLCVLGACSTVIAWKDASPESLGAVVALVAGAVDGGGPGCTGAVTGQRRLACYCSARGSSARRCSARGCRLVPRHSWSRTCAPWRARSPTPICWPRTTGAAPSVHHQRGCARVRPLARLHDHGCRRHARTRRHRGKVVAIAGDTRRRHLALRGLDFSATRVWGLPLNAAIDAYGDTRFVLFGLGARRGPAPRDSRGPSTRRSMPSVA